MITQVIQYFTGTQGLYADHIKGVANVCARNGVTYKLITERPKYLGEPDDPRKDSTIVRLIELIADPSALFLDSDTIIEDRIFSFEYVSGKPYVGNGTCGAHALYGNGCVATFKNILDVYDKSKWCICVQYLLSHKDEFNVFPEGFITHLRLWGKR